MLELRKVNILRIEEELGEFARMYVNENDETFIKTSYVRSFVNLQTRYANGNFIRGVYYDGNLVGWILAVVNMPEHSSEKYLNQMYYCCTLKGLLAAKALKLAHEALIAQAEYARIPYVISQCSFYDEAMTFARLLEKYGWERRGHTALWRTSHFKG